MTSCYDSTRRVFCEGPILEAVHKFELYGADSKAFVDSPLLCEAEEVLEHFLSLQQRVSIDAESLRDFVRDHFGAPGTEFVAHTPEDFNITPPKSLLMSVRASSMPDALERWVRALHQLWLTLCRRVRDDVLKHPSRTTLLPRRHPFVVPGGRFRETYYWDSYWIVLGLLASGLRVTAREMVENLLDDVLRYGFCPNGSRLYYLNRSQPPLLSDMVMALLADGAVDVAWLRTAALPALDREHAYWQRDRHRVRVRTTPSCGGGGNNAVVVELNRYCVADPQGPRPESWPEDHATAATAVAEGAASKPFSVYRELATAAESGWDFSSRWVPVQERGAHVCSDDDGDGGDADVFCLWRTQPTLVIPVDLNAILHRMERNLQRAHNLVAATTRSAAEVSGHHTSQALHYEATARQRRAAIEAVLWSEADGRWRDAWLVMPTALDRGIEGTAKGIGSEYKGEGGSGRGGPRNAEGNNDGLGVCYDIDYNGFSGECARRSAVFASDFLPLWAGLAVGEQRSSAVLSAFVSSGLVSVGGLSTSTTTNGKASGQQWDWPNCWPPLVAMLVEGLEKIPFAVVVHAPEASLGDGADRMMSRDPDSSNPVTTTGPRLAFELARAYLCTARAAFENSGFMYEKYDAASAIPRGGGGGEYEKQVGFGWSNGVALHLLKRYGPWL